MKKALLLITLLIMVLSFTGCDKRSDKPCSMCGDKNAYVYENELGIGEKTLSLCKDCHEEFVESVNALNQLLGE